MEEEKAQGQNLEELLYEKQRLEKELARKNVESYKLRRIAEENLSPKHIDFLKGDTEEEFEQSLHTYLEQIQSAKEQAKKELFMKGYFSEPAKTSAPPNLSEEELVKEEILRFGRQKIS